MVDVPDTLWIGTGRYDSHFFHDKEKIRQAFNEWMAPNNFKVLHMEFNQGFSWGTIRMKSVSGRNTLVDLGKTKPMKVGNEMWQVKPFLSHSKKLSPSHKPWTTPNNKATTTKPISASEKKATSSKVSSSGTSSPSQRGSSGTVSRSLTASPAVDASASNPIQISKRQQKRLLMMQHQQLLYEKHKAAKSGGAAKNSLTGLSPDVKKGVAQLKKDLTKTLNHPLITSDDDDEEVRFKILAQSYSQTKKQNDGVGFIKLGEQKGPFVAPMQPPFQASLSQDHFMTDLSEQRGFASYVNDDEINFYHQSSSSSDDDESTASSGMPGLKTVPLPSARTTSEGPATVGHGTGAISDKELSETFQKLMDEMGSLGSVPDVTLRCVKGRVISHRKSEIPLEVEFIFAEQDRPNIFITVPDVKNLKGVDPSSLVGQYLFLYLAGKTRDDEKLLFSVIESNNPQDNKRSARISDSLRAMIRFYSWAHNNESSLIETEIEKLSLELKSAANTDAIAKVALAKMNEALRQCESIKKRRHFKIGTVEIFDDDLDDDDDDVINFSTEETLLTPIVPGKGCLTFGDFDENVFDLPPDDHDDLKGLKIDGTGTKSKAKDVPLKVDLNTTATDPMELEVLSDLESWIKVFFSSDVNSKSSSSAVSVITNTLQNYKISLKEIILKFGSSLDSGTSLDVILSWLAGHLESKAQSLKSLELMTSLVQPVFFYLIAHFCPARIIPTSLKNVLGTIAFRATGKGHFFQQVGVVTDLDATFGIITSPIGFAVFELKSLSAKFVVRNIKNVLVSFHAESPPLWNEFPAFIAVYVRPVFGYDDDDVIDCQQSLTRDKVTKFMLEFSQAPNRIRDPLKAFEAAFSSIADDKSGGIYSSRRDLRHPDIDDFLISREVLESLVDLESFMVKKLMLVEGRSPAECTKLATLYVSVWARLGFTQAHLETEFTQLLLLGRKHCVRNNWLSLICLTRLPKKINAAELVRLTIEYLEATVGKRRSSGVTPEFIDELCLNQSHVDDLVNGILGRISLPKRLILPPFVCGTTINDAPAASGSTTSLPSLIHPAMSSFLMDHSHHAAAFQHQHQHLQSSSYLQSRTRNVSQRSTSAMSSSLPIDIKVQTDQGEIFKFSMDDDGNLPCEAVNAILPGTVALKFRTTDQTWRIISKSGDVFRLPSLDNDGSERVYHSVGHRAPIMPIPGMGMPPPTPLLNLEHQYRQQQQSDLIRLLANSYPQSPYLFRPN